MRQQSKLKQPLVLVTGGAGFIGGHLVDALIKKGYHVRVLDTLAPPAHNGRLPAWFNRRAEFMRGDVGKKSTWAKALEGVSYVFHFAAYMDFHLDFSRYITTNTTSTALLFETIVENKFPVKKIIAASSQAVYGEGRYRCRKHDEMLAITRPEIQLKRYDWAVRCPKDGGVMQPVAERETHEVMPANPYGISKKALEDLLMVLGRLYNISSVAVRFSIVHGPRQSFRNFYSGALRQFCTMALANKPFCIHEDGGQVRDFVHINDVINALLILLTSGAADYGVYNIGSGRPNTVCDLVKAVAKAAGVPLHIEANGLYRVGTARASIMDVSKLKKFGWEPKHSLVDNARDYFNWIKNYPEAVRHYKVILNKMRKLKIIQQAR